MTRQTISPILLSTLVESMPPNLSLCVNNICLHKPQITHFIQNHPNHQLTIEISEIFEDILNWITLFNEGALHAKL